MKTDFETEVVQNTALGAAALWQFCTSFSRKSARGQSPSLPYTMLVLPLVFHQRSVVVLAGKQFGSGLLKALYDAPDLVVGLQLRLESLHLRTLRSLNLACAAGLLVSETVSGEFPVFRPLRKTLPTRLKPSHEQARLMLRAGRRLGTWFSAHDLAFLCSQLHVRF